ncbi:MAG: Sapep family Mn(2+)-dependent dipeptidase [Ruminiclostridium sp.]|nr:Sapep family Mn(2+)-dependent dipeptidase [Ruminiclostridium sp.]
MQQRINAYFSDKEDLLVHSVSRMVRIESTTGAARPGMPFGEGPAAALDEMLRLSEELGLPGENLEGYVGVIDLNKQETALHILGHLDVVDGGEDWTQTTPFKPKLVDGILYGRGTDDDKGPMVAALLAMKAVKDLGVPLKKNVRMILGTDEETGFRDIHWYYDRHPYAPYTISPDADFPIINIEKGHYQPTFTAGWPAVTVLPRVSSLTGGPRLNMVPPKAQALVLGLTPQDIQAVCDTLDLEPNITFTLTQQENGVRILCSGVAAHGSTPEEGHNAQTALVSLLAALPLADAPSTLAIRNLAALFPHGDFTGEALGISQSDDLSGHLSLAFTRISLDDTGLEGRFDTRTPLCGTDETIRLPAEAALGRAGFSVKGEIDPPHHVPAEDPLIQTLARCYEMYSGRKSQCIAIGGGTYVHGIPGGVAFGASMPGFVSNLHGPDERVNIKDLLTAAKIYAQVILELCS